MVGIPGGKVEISTVDLMNGIKPSLRKGWRFFSVIFYENMYLLLKKEQITYIIENVTKAKKYIIFSHCVK